MPRAYNIIFVGGGLANGLAALRLRAQRPDADVLLLESGAQLGGEHTWSFHSNDLGPGSTWVQALATKSWPAYDVRFPGQARTLSSCYHAIRSADFAAYATAQLGACVRLQTTVSELAADGVRTADGAWIAADLVVDGRGPEALGALPGGYQKFLGQVVRTERPHGFERPVVMDATVPQLDGFRFVYVLPWSETELLIEDTYYSTTPDLPVAVLRARIDSYRRQYGLAEGRVLSEERGVLPIPFHGARAPVAKPGLVQAGLAAGLFHPTTGYSFSEAVQFAEWLAEQPVLTAATVAGPAAARAASVWERGQFFRRLNNMLFMAGAPDQRFQVLAQFYRRAPALIGRFYGGQLATLDTLRLLSGKPPVPLVAGLKAFFARVADA